MGFADFRGNPEVVWRLRQMLARDRFPHAVILAGARGAGKYTLAQMLAKAMNCLERPLTPAISPQSIQDFKTDRNLGGDSQPEPENLPDFCGRCSNCLRIAQADELEARVGEAIEARESLRESEKRETRILVQTHAEVMIIPPDPPQMLVKVDQVRHVIGSIYFKPGEGRQKVYIFPEPAFMKEAANALLKVLEEPPEFATIFLLAENAGSLLPTIRSRCISLTLAPLGLEEIEQELRGRTGWSADQRTLVARLSGGAIGRARGFDLDAYLNARHDALLILKTAFPGMEHAELFRATETYRAGAEGRERTEQLILSLYSLLRDLLAVQSKTPDLVRNIDILPDLERLARGVNFAWLAAAAERVGEVQSGMRRNLLRSLSLDALAAALEI
ncbi:MAG: DNA polymerase III subunit delta' [Candidatus Korobacteraceae bacterium]